MKIVMITLCLLVFCVQADYLPDYFSAGNYSNLSESAYTDSDVAEELLNIYVNESNEEKRNAIKTLMEKSEKRASSYTRVTIPCDDIKQFTASRQYKAVPYHTPVSGWAYETKTKGPFTTGIIGSKEGTGANPFKANAYWNRLWIKFDISSLSAYTNYTVIDAELVIYKVTSVPGIVESYGLPCRITRTAPSQFTDANYSTLLPSDANTPYDYIYHEYNNGELPVKVQDGLRIHGYPNEYARLGHLDKAVQKWQTDGNNGIILFHTDLSAKDSGNRHYIKNISRENIFLIVDLVENK